MKTLYYVSYSVIPSHTANSVHVARMCSAFCCVSEHIRVCLIARVRRLADLSLYGEVHKRLFVAFLWSGRAWGEKSRYLLKIFLTLAQAQRQDIVYGRYLAGLLLASGRQRTLVYEAHVYPTGMLRRVLEWALFQRPDFSRLVVISQALADEYVRRRPYLIGKIQVAHDGADLVVNSESSRRERPGVVDTVSSSCPRPEADADTGHRVAPTDYESDVVSEVAKRRIQTDTPVTALIGYVGSFVVGKGADFILDIAQLRPSFLFYLVGGTGTDFDRVQKKLQGLGLHNVLLERNVPHANVPGLLARCDVLLAPYQQTVFAAGGSTSIAPWMSPLKLFEYMSVGKPIICSDLPVLREVMRHRDNCLLASPDSAAHWARALDELTDNAGLAQSLGRKANEDLAGRYTWTKRAESILRSLPDACCMRSGV
jgi:glycosyltransferase involved in cell wall biosynthesis